MLEQALSLAASGFKVFPVHYPVRTAPDPVCSCRLGPTCQHVGKHPATEHGFTDASGDPTTIKRLWQRDHNYNIGLPTGAHSFDVLDEDPQHGGDASLRALEAEFGPLPETPRSRTGGGGHHFLYQHIPGARNDNRGTIGQGLDFKTDGGYIVAPPSLHVSGAHYAWLNPEVPIAPAPRWLVQRMQADRGTNVAPHRRPPRADEFWYKLALGVAEGQRSDAMTSVAGLLLDLKGLDPRLAIRLIYGYNTECCDPPLDRAEVATIITSLAKKIAKDG